jgi:hypothetical protein
LQKRIIILTISFLIFAFKSKAQNAPITDGELLYYKDYNLGFNLNTYGGGGIYYRYGWHKTGSKKNVIESEFAYIRHPKEVWRYGYQENPSSYTYGRLNFVYFWRNSIGQKIELTERSYKNALGLNFVYNVGLTIALLKPAYIDYFVLNPDNTNSLVSVKYDPNIHVDEFRIYGNGPFLSGLNEIDAKIGLFGRVGLNIEYGQYPDEYKSLEAGITLDAFNDKLPMVTRAEQIQFFPAFYVAFNFGWKN